MLYRICVTLVHSVNGLMRSASSGTTIVSPGLITTPPTAEPATRLVRDHAAIRPHHVDSTLVSPRGKPAAQRDVIIAGQAVAVKVGGRALDLAEYRHFLRCLRNQQLVSLTHDDVGRSARLAGENCGQVDDQPANRLGGLELCQELLTDCQRLGTL